MTEFLISLTLVACLWGYYQVRLVPKARADNAVYRSTRVTAAALVVHADKLKRRKSCGKGSDATS